MKYLLVTIGVDNFGKLSFIQSFLLYFTIIVDYGFNITATREIARSKTKEEISTIFANTMTAKFLLLLFCSFAYLLLVLSIPKFSINASLYFLFWGVVVGGCLFPQWYFQGIQRMGYITLVNVIIKVLLLISVFIFVKTSADTKIVPAIYSISFIIPGVYAFYLAYKNCNKCSPKKRQVIIAYKQGFPIFLSTAVSTILNGSTIFILGFIVTNAITGYYAGYDKLIHACTMLFAPITTAIYPHVSTLISQNKNAGIGYIKKSAFLTVTLAIVLSLLLAALSKWIIPIIFTSDYLYYKGLLYILLGWMIFSVANNFIGIQYLTCIGESKIYAKLLTFSGIVTLILIFLFTKKFSCYGAATAILIGEALLTLLMVSTIKVKKL